VADDLDIARMKVEAMLAAGPDTDWKQRAYTGADIQRVLAALSALAPDDVNGKLRVAGFTVKPYVGAEDPEIEQSCRTCMYYEAHRRYCALPELKLPVEPEWSCILWRI
jgi:hypothetical protein